MRQLTLLRHTIVASFALVAAMLAPSLVGAQQKELSPVQASVESPAIVTASAPLAGPRAAQSGVTRLVPAAGPAPYRAPGERRDVAWMIVGGAALVVGSMIGGDGGTIIMITGGVIGLVGLMRYLQ